MSNSSNTSQFVKTYGKPRRTQGLGHDSLWHDDLVDSFDKCFGIDDVPQTTFISPESVGSVTMYKSSAKYKTVDNKMKTISGWSMQLHSTLSDHKTKLTTKKRNIEYSFENNCKKNLSLKSVEKKKNDNSIHPNFSSKLITDSKIACNSKITSTTKNKSKKNFILSKEQCSTPLGRSIYGNKSNNMSSNKKKKKKKNALNASYFSELSKKPDYLLKKKEDKYIHLDQSVQISGSHIIKPFKREQSSINKNTKNEFFNNQKKNHKSVLNKHTISRRYKKKYIQSPLKEKNSNWFNKVMNVFCNEESNSSIKSYDRNCSNEDISTLKKSLGNYSSESFIICHKTKNVVAKPSEQQIQLSPCTSSNNESFRSIKHINKSMHHDSSVDISELNKYIVRDYQDIGDGDIETSQAYVLSGEDSSKVFENSLYMSCYEIEKKVIKNTEYSNIICTSDDDRNVDSISIVNRPSITYKLNQFETPLSCNNSTCIISNRVDESLPLDNSRGLNQDNSYKSSADSLDVKLLNMLEHGDNNSLIEYVNCNQTPSISAENISFQSNNNQLICSASEPQILEDVTHTFSNFTIDDKIELYDQFIIEESILEEFDQSLNNKSTPNQNSNNSSSNLYKSSSSEQETIIYKQNDKDIDSKENSDSNSLFLSENESLKMSSICFSKKDSIKCNDVYDDIHPSNSKEIVLEQTSHNHSQDELDTICHSNTCQLIMKNKLFNSDNSYILMENEVRSDYDQSIFNQSNTSIENISSVKLEKTVYENQANISNSEFDDEVETQSNLFGNVSRRKRYACRFENSFKVDSYEKSADEKNVEVQKSPLRNYDLTQSIWSQQNLPNFRLEPGKKWRRSILIVRSLIDGCLDQTTDFVQNTTKGRKWVSTVDDILRQQSINTTIHQKLNQSNILKNSLCCRSSQRISTDSEKKIARKYIFNECNQEIPLSFESWLEPNIKKKWKKIGEGVYGEVFSYTHRKSNVVVKVIPIEGENYINSERQKTLFEVYSEILIVTELKKLFDDSSWNHTNSFCKLKKISCVQGKYPKHLIRLWEQYNDVKGSDNDNPNILPDNQMFMVLEMEDGGIDVESFVFNTAYQALFAFLQTVFGLAVAEQQFDFEHRDLHIGNILVKKILARKPISFNLDGETFTVPSQGVKITIIDFTLSRMSHYNKPVYNDLAKDTELFTADGDYQFEIYRLMREETNNQWSSFKPKTNIYWLHYVLDKMLTSVHYKNTTSKVHNTGLNILNKIKNSILCFDSAKSLAESCMILDLLKQ